jgi:GAF domain-containing protein
MMEPNSTSLENQAMSNTLPPAQIEPKQLVASGIVKPLLQSIARIREALDLDEIFQATVTEVRQFLNADRVAVFQFFPERDCYGEFVCEDIADGWNSAIKEKVYDYCFREKFASHYREDRVQAVADIYNAGLSDCHIEILGKFQVRANLIAPLLRDGELWGLLCVHQCSEPRQWNESEIEFVRQIGDHLTVGIQQATHLQEVKLQATKLAQAAQRDRLIAQIVDKIRQSLDIETIFKTTTQEVRQLLQADRVAIFRFHPDWSGNFVAESHDEIWQSLVGVIPLVTDTHLQETQGGRYRSNETSTVDDIYFGGLKDCHITLLEQFQAKAYAIAPIFQGDKLWGLIAAYQNSSPRQWQSDDIQLLVQIGSQMGMALLQQELLAKAQYRAEQQKTLTRVIPNSRILGFGYYFPNHCYRSPINAQSRSGRGISFRQAKGLGRGIYLRGCCGGLGFGYCCQGLRLLFWQSVCDRLRERTDSGSCGYL